MINLNDCKYVVWGYTYPQNYRTHTHIHHGFYRALLLTRKKVLWLDHSSDLTGIDFSDTMFISEHAAAKLDMPIRDDSFYVIHGLNDDPELSAAMFHVKNRLSWNVFHDFSHGNSNRWDGKPLMTVYDYDRFLDRGVPDVDCNFERVFLGEDAPFYPKEKHMDFRWATDLVPSEIAATVPVKFPGSPIINWIGTQWFVNEKELTSFKKACDENSINFSAIGAGQNGVVTIEENIKLVRESYFAPAISGSHHLREGYAPCRIFKNISYGTMGVTNSKRVNDLFDRKLIYNPDPYELFYQAKEELPKVTPEQIRSLMNHVSKNHTYLNRLDVIKTAAKFIMEDR